MRTMRWVTAAAALGCLLLAGCQTGGQPSGSQTTSPPTSTTSDQSGGRGPCPVGTWKLANLQTSTPVQGGDLKFSGGGSLTLTMNDDGTWKLSDDGSRPLSAQVSSSGVAVAGTVTIRGSANGKYAKVGDQYAFQLEGSEGTAELKSDVVNQTFDMDEMTNALVPSGQAAVSCPGTKLEIESGSFAMTWDYAGDVAGSGTAASPTSANSGTPLPPGAGTLVISTPGNHDCAGQNVQITTSALDVNLSGQCGRIEINGSGNTLTVASANTLTVTGSGNNVSISSVTTIEVTGSGNTVKWSGTEPTIKETGVGNNIQRG